MSFGRNPHVAKAQAEEQKAQDATDDRTWSRGYLEAARQWDRAAEKEKPGKQRTQYEDNATRARELAERGRDVGDAAPVSTETEDAAEVPSTLRSQIPGFPVPGDKSLN